MDHPAEDASPDETARARIGRASLMTPVAVHAPTVPEVPLVFASGHSGRDYHASFLATTRLEGLKLRRSEDSYVDELFGDAPSLGIPLLCATFPRAYCDPNRERWELDPAMFADPLPPWVNTTSARVNAGLGTLARVVSSGEPIYRDKLRFADAQDRVHECWDPYHEALSGLLGKARASFGQVLLVDCHSMPVLPGPGGPGPDIVLGDAHGTACAPALTRTAEMALGGAGYSVRRNDPYSGGYVTRHYGRPRDGVHVLQVEVARRLYMDETRLEKHGRFEQVRGDMGRLMTELTRVAALLFG